MDAANQPPQVNRVLDEDHAGVREGRISASGRDVVDGQQDSGQELQNDQDEDHPAEAVVEGVGEVGDALVHRLVDGFGEWIAFVEPLHVAVVQWLDERYPFTKSIDEAMYQRVPNFANAFYYCFGGMVFVLIVLQLLTGILLAIYYVPDARGNPAPAYTSVIFIQNTVY